MEVRSKNIYYVKKVMKLFKMVADKELLEFTCDYSASND